MTLTYPGIGPVGGGGAGAFPSVALWSDLPAPTGSEDRYYVSQLGASFTDVDVEGRGWWLPDSAVRNGDDDTLRTVTYSKDANDNPLFVEAGGDDFPATWTSVGTNSVGAENVSIGQYVLVNSASTAPLTILAAKLSAAPPTGAIASPPIVGVSGGSNYGGTDRYVGVLYTSSTMPADVAVGTYGVNAGLIGNPTADTDTPTFVVTDFRSANALCILSDKDSMVGAVTKRSSLSTASRWFQLFAMDTIGGALGAPLLLEYAVQFDVEIP